MKTYEKPVVSVDTGLAEGVYAASGATQGLTAVKVLLRLTGQALMELLHSTSLLMTQ